MHCVPNPTLFATKAVGFRLCFLISKVSCFYFTDLFLVAITKDEFLSTVDLISSTLVDSGSYSPISGQLSQTVFSSTEREKLCALPHGLRRTRLQEIMGMISDQDAGATTDEDLLKGEVELSSIDPSPSPPPLPPRTKSTSSFNAEDLNKAEELLNKTPKKLEEDSVVKVSTNTPDGPKAKPRGFPRKLPARLTKSSSSSLKPAPTIDRSLKPNIPKPLKSPRKKRQHTNNGLSQMYSQGGQTSATAPSKKTPGFFTFQGKSVSAFPLATFGEDSDSSNSDFEDFVPPQRRKFTSESQVPEFSSTASLPIHTPLDRRGSSPFPSSRPQSKEYQPIKKSSPILTKRPLWFTRKMTSPALLESIESPVHEKTSLTLDSVRRRGGQDAQSKALRKKKGRSRSLDTRTNTSLNTSGNMYSLLDLHTVALDSDDNTGGTIDSSGYARPFEHINSWRKLIGMDDGSAFSGSLPHLADNVSSAINNDEDSDACTYLDPREIAQKLEKNMPPKVRRRLDTVLSNTYLQLVSVQPPQFAELPPLQPPNVIAATPVEPSKQLQEASKEEASFKEKWENRSLDFIERPDSCLSGYTSDGLSDVSSIWNADRSDPDTEDGDLDEKIVNPYDEIKPGSTSNSYSTAAEALGTTTVRGVFDNAIYSRGAPGEHVDGGEEVYSVIDEVLLNRQRTDGLQEGTGTRNRITKTPPLPKPRVKKTLSKQDSGLYARLDEARASSNVDIPMEVVKDTFSECRRPPTPPPRRHKNISTVTQGSDYDEILGSKKRLNTPGVSPRNN